MKLVESRRVDVSDDDDNDDDDNDHDGNEGCGCLALSLSGLTGIGGCLTVVAAVALVVLGGAYLVGLFFRFISWGAGW